MKELIPLYVKGLMPDSQREEFDRALLNCPGLREELELWMEIRKAYAAIEGKIPGPSASAYSKIASRIKKRERAGFFSWFARPLPYAPAFIAAQLLIIVGLLVSLAGMRGEFKTLSAPAVTAEPQIKINIVFRGDTSEAEIRSLLLEIDGKIVDGPYASGLYVIGIPNEKALESTLNTLTKKRIVTMAERRY